MTWLLIATGLYAGSLAPGIEVRVTLEASNIQSAQQCYELATRLARSMRSQGATGVMAECMRQ
jgi:hypothetical protein